MVSSSLSRLGVSRGQRFFFVIFTSPIFVLDDLLLFLTQRVMHSHAFPGNNPFRLSIRFIVRIVSGEVSYCSASAPR